MNWPMSSENEVTPITLRGEKHRFTDYMISHASLDSSISL